MCECMFVVFTYKYLLIQNGIVLHMVPAQKHHHDLDPGIHLRLKAQHPLCNIIFIHKVNFNISFSIGCSVEQMIRMSWVRVPADSVIVRALGKSCIPSHSLFIQRSNQ